MSATRTAAVVLRHFYLLRGSLTRVVPLFVWVAIDIVLWGFITRYLNAVARPGLDFVPLLLGAVLLWDFFSRVMHGVTTAFFEDVWSRNFLNLFATPLSLTEYLVGLVVSSTVTSAAGLVLMLLLAIGLFGLVVSLARCGSSVDLLVPSGARTRWPGAPRGRPPARAPPAAPDRARSRCRTAPPRPRGARCPPRRRPP